MQIEDIKNNKMDVNVQSKMHPYRLDLSEYSMKIVLHHALNAAIINDIKIDIKTNTKDDYIKKVSRLLNELITNIINCYASLFQQKATPQYK